VASHLRRAATGATVKMIVVTLLAVCCGCGMEPSGTGTDCLGTCVADPGRRCVVEHCRSSTDCPEGTECEDRHCAATQPRGVDEYSLVTGFDVEPMHADIDMLENGGAVLLWTAPTRSTELVHCAVFTCLPLVGGPDGEEVIENYEQCHFTHRLFGGLEGAFDLSDEDLPRAVQVENDPDCSPFETTEPTLVVSDLLAACWAYDATHLIAASKLLLVPPDGIRDEADEIPTDATCASDFAPCYDSDEDRFGICHGGYCARRCVDASDCIVEDRDAWVSWSCVFDDDDEGALVGACDPPYPVDPWMTGPPGFTDEPGISIQPPGAQ
jgi:hypothetical protein